MENMQFEVEDDTFKCVECDKKITVEEKFLKMVEEKPEKEVRRITCPRCGAEYTAGKNPSGPGLIVTLDSSSLSELEQVKEQQMEEGT